MTLFTHVSGEYELLAGQRSWSRVNLGSEKNSGANRSLLEVMEGGNVKQSIALTGIDAIAKDPLVCKRVFGCGYALYSYQMQGMCVKRRLSAKPSATPYDGVSAFLVDVVLKNESKQPMDVRYTEAMATYSEYYLEKQAVSDYRIHKAD